MADDKRTLNQTMREDSKKEKTDKHGLQASSISKMDLLRRLIDPKEPWVLVPNGSLGAFFDFVSIF